MSTTNVNEMLAGRQARYGSFGGHAKIAQGLKAVMHERSGWDRLKPDQREALEMVQHKIARMLNGDPKYLDNIVDVVGYSTLIKNVMEQDDGIQGKVD